MKTKTYKAHVKQADDKAGTFEALVSIFGNVDHAGDRVVKGAFSKSLERWGQSGDPIPVVFSHRWDDLDAHIGKVTSAEETDDGLLVKAELDIDDDPAAAKVHRLLKDRRIREFSFAYDILDEDTAEDGANELRELDIIEVGPTLKGMNPDTVLVAAKAGRVLSGKNVARISEAAGQVRAGLDLLEQVIAEADEQTSSPDGEAGGKAKPEAKPEEPETVKGEEPPARSHVTSLDGLRTQFATDLARL